MTAPLPPLDPLLGLDGVHSYYGDSHILHGVSLSLARGRVLTLLGRNGAGKTTLLLENLTLAARRPTTANAWTLERIYALFPRLAERRNSGGATLSGGEQQMLSMARALLTNPQLLLLDEPTEGLAPLVVAEIETVLRHLKSEGLAILLVEQNLAFALAFADQIAVLGKGQIRWAGGAEEFAAAESVKHAWLGL